MFYKLELDAGCWMFDMAGLSTVSSRLGGTDGQIRHNASG